MRRLGAFGALLFLALFFTARADASVSFTVLFDALVEDSNAVCLATPVEIKSVWEDGHIATYTRVHVDRLFAGSAASEVWVKTMGGVVGHIGQQVDGEPVLRAGQQSVLFLTAYNGATVVTGRGQGQFPIVRDASNVLRVRKNQNAGALLAPRSTVLARIRSATTIANASTAAGDVLDGKTIDDAQAEIVSSWKRTHAGP